MFYSALIHRIALPNLAAAAAALPATGRDDDVKNWEKEVTLMSGGHPNG
jgi:hypothetical protein